MDQRSWTLHDDWHRYLVFSLLKPSEIASFLNFNLQNGKDRPNRSINNRDMVKKAKRNVMSEGVTFIKLYSSWASKNTINTILHDLNPCLMIIVDKSMRHLNSIRIYLIFYANINTHISSMFLKQCLFIIIFYYNFFVWPHTVPNSP